LRKQNVDQEIVDAIGTGDLSKVKLTPRDQALLTYVKLLTLNSARMQDADVQTMRDVGWTDDQIWEATFEVSMFSFLNRMADAHGLDYPTGGWFPPEMRALLQNEKPKEPGSAAPQ
jgi:alkylhydroperoxidase family enzyme